MKINASRRGFLRGLAGAGVFGIGGCKCAFGQQKIRLAAVGVLGWYIHTMIHKQTVRTGYLTTIAMVIAGALGNIIDCVCYGKIWDYAGWFHGRVVDMLYFPLIRNAAGECLFFRPVFNIADSFITVAVFLIIIFYRKDLDDSLNQIFPKKEGRG